MVGRNEIELTEAGTVYEVGKATYREIARGQLMGDLTGVLKLLFDIESHKLLGVGIMGEGVSELVHISRTVLSFDGTVEYFIDSVFNYPALAECYKTAACDALTGSNNSRRARLQAADSEPGWLFWMAVLLPKSPPRRNSANVSALLGPRTFDDHPASATPHQIAATRNSQLSLLGERLQRIGDQCHIGVDRRAVRPLRLLLEPFAKGLVGNVGAKGISERV